MPWPPIPPSSMPKAIDPDTRQPEGPVSCPGVVQAYQVVDQVLSYAVRSRFHRGQPRRGCTAAAQDDPGEVRPDP